jgi:hypothetical protein
MAQVISEHMCLSNSASISSLHQCARGVSNWRVRGSIYLPRCLAAQEDIGSGQTLSASPTLLTGAFAATVATVEASTACHLHLDSGGHNLILLVRRQRQLGQQERLVELQLVRQLGQRLPQLVWQARQQLQQHLAQRTGYAPVASGSARSAAQQNLARWASR